VPPRLRPQLLAIDLDGTAVDQTNRIPAATEDALHACHQAGIALAFLTGRRPLTTAPHLDRLGLPCRVTTNSGCLRWTYPGWELTGARYFDPALARQVAGLTAPYSVSFFVNSAEAGFEFFLLERQPVPELDHYVQHYGSRIRRIQDAAELDSARITQIALPGPADVVGALHARIQAALNEQVLALQVRWPLLNVLALELFHPEANKGVALAQFAGELGLPQARTLAVGDDVNDLAMLRWAGYGVAMPGARAELIAAADEVLVGEGVLALAPYLESLLALPVE
jgi:Cof subfamily protein (haloacid dehalogenase superfamily)